MSQYANLKAAIAANVYQNHNNEVTANMVKAAMNAMTDSLGAGYQYLGIATPTSPGTAQTPDQKVFYIATTPGTYTYLGGLVVNDGEVAVLKWDTAWHKEVTGAATAAQVTELGQNVAENTQDIEDIRQAVSEIQPIVIEGDVTNAPDEEDITTDENDLLKFANRTTLNGMGYKILRRNKTFAEQVTDIDTIYEIRYDFDLGGASVTIPAGCVLKFVGGRLQNGQIVCNSTEIIGEAHIGVFISGTMKSPFNIGWIDGVVCDAETDNTDVLVAYFEQMQDFRGTFVVPNDCYFISSVVYNVIPKGVVLLNEHSVNGAKAGGWRAKYVEIACKDDENDDTSLALISGHFPNITLVNTGTCEYSEASTPEQKSGIYRKASLSFADGFTNGGGNYERGEVPTIYMTLVGQMRTISGNNVYTFQVRPYHRFSNHATLDFAALTITENGNIGINGAQDDFELQVLPNRQHISQEGFVSLMIRNDRTGGARLMLRSSYSANESGSITLATTGNLGIISPKSIYFSVGSENPFIPFIIRETKDIAFYGGLTLQPDTLRGATPTINTANRNIIYYIKNASPTTITTINADANMNKSLFILVFKDNNTIVKHGQGIVLKHGVDFKGFTNAVLVLLKDTTESANFIELFRSVPENEGGQIRPSIPWLGRCWFDSALTPPRPIWWNGTAWVDSTGTVV